MAKTETCDQRVARYAPAFFRQVRWMRRRCGEGPLYYHAHPTKVKFYADVCAYLEKHKVPLGNFVLLENQDIPQGTIKISCLTPE